jgi:hypothetical protein
LLRGGDLPGIYAWSACLSGPVPASFWREFSHEFHLQQFADGVPVRLNVTSREHSLV